MSPARETAAKGTTLKNAPTMTAQGPSLAKGSPKHPLKRIAPPNRPPISWRRSTDTWTRFAAATASAAE